MPGSDDIVSAHNYGDILKWVRDGEGLRFQSIIIREAGISLFAISSCGQWIVTSSHRSLRLSKFTSSELQQDWKEVTLIKDFFGRIAEIAWRPDILEFATACEDGSIRVWSIVEEEEEPDKVSVKMIWDTGLTAFVASGAVLVNTVGLDMTDKRLLKQRDAVDVLVTLRGAFVPSAAASNSSEDSISMYDTDGFVGFDSSTETGIDD